jgi:hypothetical protein
VRLQAEVGWKVGGGGDETRGPRVHEESVDGQTQETGRQDAKGSYCTRVR